ncbi:hypothetical protein CORT_0B01260 [Candida orthopsilosis Co 90-125]|uniref:Uncharacterized protein n=1 Tax=Candida orthopsilosis (strain 90-125) TaxID=1136231 RepID=H8WZH7_CANO9|nr:hypothetical protein CORT_0B01260 [Candida orthopsilosis Co 90-125]CCG21845.1 hypothetical protein CORT_0B01260 [Candida orthopsilosis Co 90-125]
MAIFRSKSSNKTPQEGNIDVKITHKDEEQYKVHTANVHDPILTAVNEAQPFEQAAQRDTRRPSYLSNESADLKDIFGQPIRQTDMSNPTRNRNERPLDTIRGFEYAITGDVSYRDQLESGRLGWGFHEDFPYYNLNGQGGQDDGVPQMGGSGRPVINFDDQPVYQAQNYSASSLQNDSGKKKKKRGLFGRKK